MANTYYVVRGQGGTPLKVKLIDNLDGTYSEQSAGSGGSGGAVTVVDGGDVTLGANADVKVVGDNSGTVSAKLRGLSYLWSLAVDIVNNWVSVAVKSFPAGPSISTSALNKNAQHTFTDTTAHQLSLLAEVGVVTGLNEIALQVSNDSTAGSRVSVGDAGGQTWELLVGDDRTWNITATAGLYVKASATTGVILNVHLR